ncbi:MAG: hypothetical protein KC613_18205 [Myxococcales bacterium]|nr:hypothetical protein [Myxococcales bacterium]
MRTITLAAALALTITGCDDGDATPPAADVGADQAVAADLGPTPDGAVPDMAPDAEPDMAPDLGPVGEPTAQLVVQRWLTDAYFDYPEVYAFAAFEPRMVRLGVANAVGWLAYQGLLPGEVVLPDSPWRLPAVGERVPFTPPEGPMALADLQFADAGPWVAVGDDIVAVRNETLFAELGVHVYQTELEEGAGYADLLPGGATVPVEIAGGAQVPGGVIAAAVTLPADIELTSHEPTLALPLREGLATVVGWLPSEDPDDFMIVGIEGEFSGELVAVPDEDASYDFSELIELHAAGNELDALTIDRVRLSNRHLPQGRGALQIVSVNRQFLYLDPIGAYRVRPRVLTPGKPIGLVVEWPDGRFNPALGPTIDLGPDVRVGQIGLDTSGRVLRAVVEVAAGAPTGPRDLRVLQQGDEVLRLEGQVHVADDLPASGACADAIEEPGVPDGTWVGSLQGQPDEPFVAAGCLGFEPNVEQALPVALQAGQTLHAELFEHRFFGQLYVVRGPCDGGVVTECFRPARIEEQPRLSYTAPVDETVLLVVAANADPEDPDSGYALSLSRTAPAPLVVTPTVFTDAALAELTVRATAGGFSRANARLAVGDALAEAVEVPVEGGPVMNATVRLPETPVPVRLDVQATLADGSQVGVEGAIEIKAFTSASAACPGEQIHTEGTWFGFTFAQPATIDAIEVCYVAPEGPEAIHRVDLLPGQTLEARAVMPEADVVLYLLASCDDRTGITCVDLGSGGDPELVQYTAPNVATTVYVVVDGFSVADEDNYDLTIRIRD